MAAGSRCNICGHRGVYVGLWPCLSVVVISVIYVMNVAESDLFAVEPVLSTCGCVV